MSVHLRDTERSSSYVAKGNPTFAGEFLMTSYFSGGRKKGRRGDLLSIGF